MVRGINRQIIEVRETGNLYYERAYFVVKPEYESLESAILEKEAKKVMRHMDAPGDLKKRAGKILWRGFWPLLCFVTGLGLAWLIFVLL